MKNCGPSSVSAVAHVRALSFSEILIAMRGMNGADAAHFVRRRVFSRRFALVEELRLRWRRGRFEAEENLVADVLACTSAVQMECAFADYRRDPRRVQGLWAALLGIDGARSLLVYYFGLQQRWHLKNQFEANHG